MRRFMVICAMLLWPLMAATQEETADEDKGRIVRYLEDTLSGLGRDVQIAGFQGALSSQVSMDRMTIADADGVWLTLTGAVLDWNRAAILRGEIEIERISAEKIDVARLPVADEAASPEASSGFSLPELPVSVDIKMLAAQEVALGAPILGEPVTLTVEGAVTLESGQGQATLGIERLDGPRGMFALVGSYGNVTRQLAIDLSLDEASEGIAATLLNLPGRPALALTVKGDAPIDEFVADIALRSDGEDRLAGRISTQVVSDEGSPALEDPPERPRIISVDIAGDMTPLFAPQYRPFFGPDVAVQSLVQLYPDGRVDLEKLSLEAAALQLGGRLSLSAEGLPDEFALKAVLGDEDHGLVTLPLSGPETKVRRAEVTANFDASRGDAWIVQAQLHQLERRELTLEAVTLSGLGSITSGALPAVNGRFDSYVSGLAMQDQALSRALGDEFSLASEVNWRDGHPLGLTFFFDDNDGARMSAAGKVTGLSDAVTFDGAFYANIDDLDRLSGLADRPLAGSVRAKLAGAASLLTGAFDLELTASGTDLNFSNDKLDDALAGESTLSASAKRDENGLTLRAAEITTAAADATAKGFVSTGKSDLEFTAALDDLSRFVSGIAGPVKLTGHAVQDGVGWIADLQGSGPFQSVVEGRLIAPDDGEPSAELSGTIGNVGAIVPDLPGSASFNATARQQGDSWAIDTTGQGPGGSTFDVVGVVRSDVSAATLDIDGTLPLALANRRLQPRAAQGLARFDLRLDGPLGLSSLSGQLSTSGARVSLPKLQNALTDIDATVTLAGAEAAIKADTALATGGRLVVLGQMGLQAPFRTNLGIQVLDAVVRDPKLFETVAQGNLIVSGAVRNNLNISGRINLDNTEIRVPSTGLASGNIPDIKHVGEPRGVRLTRGYAGLLDTDGDGDTSTGGSIGLDILIAADSRVFVRGRGLDAELGGRFRVTGTAAEIIPIGGFDLIRGRMDILGKRLTLDEGTVRLQGDFVPGLRLVASTIGADGTLVRIILEGRADDPDVRLQSEPELPDDEVLARLLFGRELGSLSAFQALQLASAVATLAGKGGPSLADRIRQSTGVDDFSVSTDAEGTATVGVGKYISDNIYTDVQVGDRSNTEINLNIDLSRRTKLRGTLGSDGGSGVGIFFEKDY